MVEEKEIVAVLWKIQHIQEELKALEARVRALLPAEEKPKRFSDLKGVWAGADFSYEEIKEAEIRVKDFSE